MKKAAIPSFAEEFANVRLGKIAPGRVWQVTKHPDGTVERKQVGAAVYQARQCNLAKQSGIDSTALETSDTEPEALTARRKLGISQDRFARMIGISSATVRNWEQGRRKPTGPAKVLLRLLVQHPEVMLTEN